MRFFALLVITLCVVPVYVYFGGVSSALWRGGGREVVLLLLVLVTSRRGLFYFRMDVCAKRKA